MEEREFYITVAELLGCDDHVYRSWPYTRQTRWNNRSSGNGRYPGCGIVRRYSADKIHVELYNPRLSGVFADHVTALSAIHAALATDLVSIQRRQGDMLT
jgi:hypothetical protein